MRLFVVIITAITTAATTTTITTIPTNNDNDGNLVNSSNDSNMFFLSCEGLCPQGWRGFKYGGWYMPRGIIYQL